MSTYDAVVIGGGQAGLAAAHQLRAAGVEHLVLEASDQVGGSWPQYYDSLTLFSPARYCALPGLPMSGDQDRYPARDEVVDYLRSYAQHFDLHVRLRARVASTIWEHDAVTITLTGGERLRTRAVIAASGGFGQPHVPSLAGISSYRGEVLHVAGYRRADDYAGKRVVVVGAGNSGVQVAVELAEVADVTLATREPIRFRNQTPLGRDIHWWLKWTLDRLPVHASGAKTTPVLDTGRYRAAVEAGRPDRRDMFRRLTSDGVIWSDGVEEHVDAVLLATGYRPSLGYLPAAAFDENGWPAHRRGVSTTLPQLGYVGLPGQRSIASATLRGVGPDAARVVRALVRRGGVHSPEAASTNAQTAVVAANRAQPLGRKHSGRSTP